MFLQAFRGRQHSCPVLLTGLGDVYCEKGLKNIGLSSLENRRLRGYHTALCSSVCSHPEDEKQRGARLCSWSLTTELARTAQSCAKRGLPRGWQNTGTGSLKRWLVPHFSQYSREMHNKLLVCFNLGSQKNILRVGINDLVRSFQLKLF